MGAAVGKGKVLVVFAAAGAGGVGVEGEIDATGFGCLGSSLGRRNHWGLELDAGGGAGSIFGDRGEWAVPVDLRLGAEYFPVTSGAHTRAPLTEAAPLWERVALLNWWFAGKRAGGANLFHTDPGLKLGLWREIKLARGLVRHPVSGVRTEGCRFLLDNGWGQDECWEQLTQSDRSHMRDHGSTCCTEADVAALRKWTANMDVAKEWAGRWDRDYRRLFTTVNHPQKRAEFCRLYMAEYPEDTEHGCPADRPPPATIVTEAGDVPLVGEWPR